MCSYRQRLVYPITGWWRVTGLTMTCSRRDKHWNDGRSVRGFVEVFQIKRVVPDLIYCVALKLVLTNLELENEYDLADDEYNVDSSAQARQHKLEQHEPAPRIGREYRSQYFNLLAPSLELGRLDSERAATGQSTADFVGRRLQESLDRALKVRAVQN